MNFLKRIIKVLFISFLIIIFSLPAFCASVPPQRFDGNDSNPNDYSPPPGCIHFEIPGSGTAGTYTVRFNSLGQPDPNGANIFNVTVGTRSGTNYTQVLTWSSNFALYAVIVKGGDAFNLYPYPSSIRTDTFLVSPDNASGRPADVSHVSIVFCPGSSSSSSSASSQVTPTECCGIINIVVVSVIVAFFILGTLIGLIICVKCGRRHC